MERTGAPQPPMPFQPRNVGVSPNYGTTITKQQQDAAAAAQVAAVAATTAAATPAPETASAAAASSDNQLPPGWTWSQDPSSGRVYYINTTSGATQWEPPTPAPAPAAPAPAPVTMAAAVAPKPAEAVPGTATPQLPQQDGFISRQQLPPGSMAATPSAGPAAAAPASTGGGSASITADTSAIPPESAVIVPSLNNCLARLGSAAVPARQLSVVYDAVNKLLTRLNAGDIPPDVAQKALQMVQTMEGGNCAEAMSIHKALVEKHWSTHKDWLKGIKQLIQLMQKC